ncbi:MAG: sensor histidine kinase [Clostridiales Family XIII bacterium]|nr:sensor histidine kinase [Clostridiales Family XIII bacterium]
MAFLLRLLGQSPFSIMYIAAVMLLGGLLSLLPEFLTKRRYYGELKSIMENLDKKFLLSEIIERPDFVEGQLLYDTLGDAGKSMNDEIAGYKNAYKEYREFIELWVHEIKTPIAGAKLIGENAQNAPALEELDRIEFFVEQALYYARSNAVENDYIIKPALLSDMVGDVLKNNAKYLIANRISVRTSALDLRVFTDVKWVSFIIRQIVDNAVKYGGNTIEFFGESRGNSVALFIKDDGQGIPGHEADKVFEKGFTGSNGRIQGHSTGLGLYLCRKLCHKLGLGLSLESTPGEGTTLKIVFPINEL